jgi:hypothetical protein
MMHLLLAGAILAHSMAQSTLELLALLGPFAIVFGAGILLVIGPIIRTQGEKYQHHPIRGDEKTPHSNGSNGSNGSTKPSRAAASSAHTEEDQVAASSGTASGEEKT